MTTKDQNSTSKSGASDDADEAVKVVTDSAAPDDSAEVKDAGTDSEEQAAGFFPPVPDSIDHTVHLAGGPGPFPGAPGEGPNPFAAPNGPFPGPYGPGAPDGNGPFAPGGPGPYGAPGFPPTGSFPPPDAGQFAPPPNPGAPNGFPPGGPQEVAADGEKPGEPGHFGGPGQPGQFAPSNDQPGGPIYSWSPPPAAPPQPQPQMGFQPGWNPQQQQGFPQQQQPPQGGFGQQFGQPPMPPGHSVNDLNLLKRAKRAPRSGWRRAVHKASGGAINPGESAADVVYRQLVDRVNQPVRGDYRIAILSLKGGVGKTTTTVGLGSTFASLRGDRVIAIDANPDLGTLAHRVPRQTRSTVRNLLEDGHISRYSDVRAHTSQAPSRLEVLASEQDPAVSEAFSEADYRKAIGILQQFYNIILTDCGTGLMHSAMSGVLDMASSLVLVTSPAIDGARSASATLDWLDHHGYHKLVERTVVVVNASRKGSSTVDLDQLRKLFLDRTRAVQVVPFDDHLAEGAEIDLELVGKPTRRALLELAAMVADDFGYAAAQQGFPPHGGFQPQPPHGGFQPQQGGFQPQPGDGYPQPGDGGFQPQGDGFRPQG